jgi:DEAD/DEAH box helicase domain-containing protein
MPYPAQHVSIRGVEEERYTLVDVTQINSGGALRILEEIEVSRALFEIYEGAVVSSDRAACDFDIYFFF